MSPSAVTITIVIANTQLALGYAQQTGEHLPISRRAVSIKLTSEQAQFLHLGEFDSIIDSIAERVES